MACSVLIAGCGDLGSAVAQRLNRQVFDIHALRYRGTDVPAGAHLLQADVTNIESLAILTSLRPEILLYCVAADARTDQSYKAHYVDGLTNVLAQMERNSLRRIFFISSTSVYGQESTADWLDEDNPAVPTGFSGRRMLQAEALLADSAMPYTILRLSGIYGPGRLRMIHLARASQNWPEINTWTNRIHRDDAAGFIAELIVRSSRDDHLENCYLLTDSLPVSQHELLMWLAEKLGVEPVHRVTSALIAGRRLNNSRMLNTGFSLRYPDYRHGYTALLESI